MTRNKATLETKTKKMQKGKTRLQQTLNDTKHFMIDEDSRQQITQKTINLDDTPLYQLLSNQKNIFNIPNMEHKSLKVTAW